LYFGQASGLSHFSAVVAFSLIVNTLVFFVVSALSSSRNVESRQAQIFTNILKLSPKKMSEMGMWQAVAPFQDIKSLLITVLGDRRTEEVLDRYARINKIDFSKSDTADPRMVNYAERLLTQSIGPASARVMISRVAKGDEIGVDEILDILQESKELNRFNKALRQKTEELELVTNDLKTANQRLTEYSEIKDEFLYTVTHELRTPLTVIRSQAEMLLDDNEMPIEDREMFLSVMVKECERLTNLITNVLDLEKFESGSQKLELQRTATVDLLVKAINAANQLIVDKPIHIQLQSNSSLPDILTDYDRIYQVMINLLSNAIKFCDQEEGEILITTYRLQDFIKINVEDNGKGILEEDRNRVFEKFYQMKHQTIKKPSGSGLGLAISKNIIQMHGGKIWNEESKLGGAKFCITLPIYINGK
jgi:signal transduction histidine kinase